MAIVVKSAGEVATKWRTRAAAAGADYTKGVQGAGQAWEAGARAGAANYRDAVTQAAGEGRYERGIGQAGAARYLKKAVDVGSVRYGPGVNAAEGDMAAGIGPVLQTIASIELPARRPKGDPSNINRSAAIGIRLHAMKIGK